MNVGIVMPNLAALRAAVFTLSGAKKTWGGGRISATRRCAGEMTSERQTIEQGCFTNSNSCKLWVDPRSAHSLVASQIGMYAWRLALRFSQISQKRRRCAPPFLAHLIVHLFRIGCQNFSSRSPKVSSRGQVK